MSAPAGPVRDAAAPAALRLPSLAALPWRRALILVLVAAAWQAAALGVDNPLMLPSFTETARAFVDGLTGEGLLTAAAVSLATLLKGYAIGIALGLALTVAALSSPLAREALATLTAMFNPLPAIALLPLAMLWFGLGETALLFVLVHAVVWPFALAALSGFLAVPETLRMVGRNIGLRRLGYVAFLLVPAAFPALLSGMRIAWAFAWRTLIAAELVFGVSSGKGGLGWMIFQNRNELYIDRVFAGLAMVVLIGLLAESVVFRTLEARTVRRWGMQR